MKEFAMKHPFITFFMVDGLLVTINNCVAMITDHNDWAKERMSVKFAKGVADDVEKVIDIAEVKRNESNDDCE